MSEEELKALNAARIELAQKMIASLESLMADFKAKTGIAVRELEIETISQNYMDGRVHCLINKVDVQLDIQIAPANGIGPTTLITFS